MKLKETEFKKIASLAINHENGCLLQKECLVDLQTGEVTVGDLKVERSNYDPKSKITSTEVHYRGKEFSLENLNDKLKVQNMGAFLMESLKKETITESKLKNVNPMKAAWKN